MPANMLHPGMMMQGGWGVANPPSTNDDDNDTNYINVYSKRPQQKPLKIP